MNRQQSLLAARGVTDKDDRLLNADDPLAQLHERCGGVLPGVLAIPELLELVRQSRQMGLRLAREFSAFDGEELVSGFARIDPFAIGEDQGCELLIENWQRAEQVPANSRDQAEQTDEIDRASAEIVALLDTQQKVQLLSSEAEDANALQREVASNPGKLWSDYVELQEVAHQQPLHWRLLDGTHCRIAGSDRAWRVRIIPIGSESTAPRGFDLLLISDEPLAKTEMQSDLAQNSVHSRLIGTTLTPVLRQPIARVIANAETIRSRLAGPLKPEYSEYAGHIVTAGKHLSAMLDDLADLEVVEAPGFTTESEPVDLIDAAKRAAGILGVKAQNRSITVEVSDSEHPVIAIGEFRRVLQILINLIGNAIAYSPEGTKVQISAGSEHQSDKVFLTVADEGPGVAADQVERIFDKFERLGRDSDGGKDQGSGLGLYISFRLAQAMDGKLEVVMDEPDEPQKGATFRLILPVAA